MKKTYIIPSLYCVDTVEDEQILAGSITGVSYDGSADPIEIGGQAGDGDVSDSKGSIFDGDAWQ